MNEYEVVDYGIFGNAISATKAVNLSFDTSKTQLAEIQTALKDEQVFLGPICDSCNNALTKGTDAITKLSENFVAIENYFIETSSTYKAGDDNSAKVLSLSSDGKLEASTLQSYQGGSGEPVYYYQKGYFDENGNLHEWPTTWTKSIADSGCGPTSLASVLATMLGDKSITPSTIADTMVHADSNTGGRFIAPNCKRYGLDSSPYYYMNKDNVNTFLRNNGKLVVSINDGKHYIAVLGINDSTNPPTYVVCDPNVRDTATRTWKWEDITNMNTMCFYIAPPGRTVPECLPAGAVCTESYWV